MLNLNFDYNALRAKNSQRFSNLSKSEKEMLKEDGYKNIGKKDVRYSDFLLKVFLDEELTPQENDFKKLRKHITDALAIKYVDVDTDFIFLHLKLDLIKETNTLYASYNSYYQKTYGNGAEIRRDFYPEIEMDAGQTEEEIAQEQAEWDALPDHVKKQIEELQREKRELQKENQELKKQLKDRDEDIDSHIAARHGLENANKFLDEKDMQNFYQVSQLEDEVDVLDEELTQTKKQLRAYELAMIDYGMDEELAIIKARFATPRVITVNI